MPLILHHHPLSSSCHKVLIALYELGIPFEGRFLDFGNAEAHARFLALWPTGKMPLLEDDGQVVPETTIIIEHLVQRHARGAQTLIPPDPQTALEVRLMERLLDLYVMMPMQAIVADHLRAEADRDPLAVAQARATLATTYGLLEQRLAGREWMAGDAFSMADCTAAPALFYATTLVPLADTQRRLASYFERVQERPSVARVLAEAGPYFRFYPFSERLPRRYFQPGD